MPLYYDLVRAATTNATGNTESYHLWGHTVANQETTSILAVYVHAQNFGTAGSGVLRLKDNTGTATSGGTAQTPAAKNRRYGVAALSVWANDATTITAGGTYTVRESIGWAQTGGMGGWVAMTPQQALQMMPNTTNPVDVDISSLAFTGSVPIEITVDIAEGT